MKNSVHALLLLLIGFAFMQMQCGKDSSESVFNPTPGENGLSGSITRFKVLGDYLYALNPNGVLTYDVHDPERPILTHTLETEYGLETITIYDGYVYVGSRNFLYILDITVAAQPKLLSKTAGGITIGGGCDPVVVKGNYAYSTIKTIANVCGNVSSSSTLLVFDVSNKSNPIQVGQYGLIQPNGLGISGNFLFICDEGLDKLAVFDISNPLSLVELPDYFVNINDPVDLIVNGNKMIVSTKTSFNFYDITDISNIKKLGTVIK